MSDVEERKYNLERWKVVMLCIGAISTFLTFFIPFANQREQQIGSGFSETLQRLGDANPAVRAGAVIDLVDFYRYRRFFGLGSSPYQKRCIFVLQNSLKMKGEEAFVRQAMIQALQEIGSNTMEDARLKGADLSDLDLRSISFRRADLSYADLSGATACELRPSDTPVSFEESKLYYADMRGIEFWGANFKRASLERANLSGAMLFQGTDLSKAFLWCTDLTNADLKDFEDPGKSANLEGAIIDNAILIGTDPTRV